MSIISAIENIRAGIDLAMDLFELGQSVMEMVARGEADRVHDILPTELRTSIARHAADARAAKKFDTETAR